MIRVVSVAAIGDYRLKVKLSNRAGGVFDVKPYLGKEIFKELKDPDYFGFVKVAFGSVMWPHEQDFVE
ncbi:DUF2442 domain-containing protein [Plasticicumulans lactativorans]|uniref:DUF2442 domain-containing protein n=1 Tax=Plasticicumulans lactativorans TaxID=1133106 RepID=UPI001042C28E|nr:DUF2442 domain-containing protein [Plasticicumulans lactativorans]